MIDTKPRILCVDDEPNVLKFLEAVFVPNGYEVTKAENGEEALEKIKKERIDLILSDVTMPQMDGFELCRKIKEDERYRGIPVVMITGLTAKADRVKGIEAGAADFISKPIDAAEVLARVRMLLKAREEHERKIGRPSGPHPVAPGCGRSVPRDHRPDQDEGDCVRFGLAGREVSLRRDSRRPRDRRDAPP
jgi:DNA-binding response OmpR family regulator